MIPLIPFLHSHLDDAGLSATDFRLLAHYYRVSSKGRNTCYEKHKTVSKITGICERSIPAAVERLEGKYSVNGSVRCLISVMVERVGLNKRYGIKPSHDLLEYMLVPREFDEMGLTRNEFRIYFHIRRAESVNSPCRNSIEKISDVTRIHHQYVKKAIKSLFERGLLIREGGWSTRFRLEGKAPLSRPMGYDEDVNPLAQVPVNPVPPQPPPETDEPNAASAMRMPGYVAVPASFQRPLTLDEMDEAESGGIEHSQLADPTVVRCKIVRERLRLSVLNDGPTPESRVILLLRDHGIEEPPNEKIFQWLKEVERMEWTTFAALDEKYSRAATMIYGWLCFARKYPNLYTDVIGDIDVERTKDISMMPYDVLKHAYLIRAATWDNKSRAAREISRTYKYCGTALCSMRTNLKKARRIAPEFMSAYEPRFEQVPADNPDILTRAQRQLIT